MCTMRFFWQNHLLQTDLSVSNRGKLLISNLVSVACLFKITTIDCTTLGTLTV